VCPGAKQGFAHAAVRVGLRRRGMGHMTARVVPATVWAVLATVWWRMTRPAVLPGGVPSGGGTGAVVYLGASGARAATELFEESDLRAPRQVALDGLVRIQHNGRLRARNGTEPSHAHPDCRKCHLDRGLGHVRRRLDHQDRSGTTSDRCSNSLGS
jgi:hypothetical protein